MRIHHFHFIIVSSKRFFRNMNFFFICLHIHCFFKKHHFSGEFLSDVEPNGVTYEDEVTYPRGTVPQPLEYEPINATMSPTPQSVPNKKIESCLDISSESSSEDDLGAKPVQVKV